MPDLDALSAIGQKSETLLHKSMENSELCSAFIALMTIVCDEVQIRGAKTVRIANASMSGNRIIANVEFLGIFLPSSSMTLPTEAADFLEFTAKEMRALSIFLKTYPDTLKFLADLVRLVDTHARHKGLKFEDVKFSEKPAPILSNDGTLVLEIANE